MDPTIETPRLRLVRLHNTDLDSQHLQWFHHMWTDDAATAWSLHGKCHTLEASQKWMTEQLTKHNNILYGIFEKHESPGTPHPEPGLLIGMVGLRTQNGPTLPPFPPPTTSSAAKPLNLRSLGYSFQSSWGKRYATEASRAFLDAYASSVAAEKAKGEEIFYIEGSWDKDKPASQKVLQKLGFKEVGWKLEEVFLAGKWRDPGYWIYGMYLE